MVQRIGVERRTRPRRRDAAAAAAAGERALSLCVADEQTDGDRLHREGPSLSRLSLTNAANASDTRRRE